MSLKAAHEETCLLLQRKAEILLSEKQEALRRLEEESPDSFEAEALRREIQEMTEFPEYLNYLAEFGELTSSSSDSASSQPIRGPIGAFIGATVVSDDGARFAEHEERFAAPARRWHAAREEAAANNGSRPKRKRQARASGDEVLGAALSRLNAELTEIESEAPRSTSLQDNSRAYGDRQADYLRPRGGYKRANHMSECLNQRQGKETTKIPPSLVETMMAERKKHAWLRTEDISSEDIRLWLRKNGLANWYEHIPRIRAIVTGTPPPTLSPGQEERVRAMFKQCELAFERVPPEIKQRHNFLTYDYTIFKIFELCGFADLLEDYKLLKTQERVQQHDRVWEHICDQLGWQFIPTSVI